jgi:hypothetical protein
MAISLEDYAKLYTTILDSTDILNIDSQNVNLTYSIDDINKSLLVPEYLIAIDQYDKTQFDYSKYQNLIEKQKVLSAPIERLINPI